VATPLWGLNNGLDLDSLTMTQEESDHFLSHLRRDRGPLYEVTANTVWFEHRPDFAKLHRRATSLFDDPLRVKAMVMSFANLHSYINLAWEVGILNEFRVLQKQGVTRAQLLDVVMTAQLTSGMRGLECVYRGVGGIVRDFQDRATPATFPAGWTADSAAFQAGLDTSTKDLTPTDLERLTAWYRGTIGEVPLWVTMGAAHHPRLLKATRLKWEGAFRGGMPKQVMPYLMLRHNTLNGYADGVREAALLGKAWGMTKDWVVDAVWWTAYYFTGMEVLSSLRGLAEVLDTWDEPRIPTTTA
jgi:hypothetical protein